MARFEAFDRIVEHVLAESDDINVVIGPTVHPPLGRDGPDYFVIATSEKDRGFRCDQISTGQGYDGATMRSGVIMALVRRRPLVIHSTDDELYMTRLCERLWPDERITKIRKGLEEERAEAAG